MSIISDERADETKKTLAAQSPDTTTSAIVISLAEKRIARDPDMQLQLEHLDSNRRW